MVDEHDPSHDAQAERALIGAALPCPCVCHRPEVIAEDLRRQMAEEDAAVLRRIRETSYDVSDAADWSEIAKRPTHAELEERRSRWGYSDPEMEKWRQAAAERFKARRRDEAE